MRPPQIFESTRELDSHLILTQSPGFVFFTEFFYAVQLSNFSQIERIFLILFQLNLMFSDKNFNFILENITSLLYVAAL